MDKYKGQFDQGWDKYREETYRRQLKLRRDPGPMRNSPAAARDPGIRLR